MTLYAMFTERLAPVISATATILALAYIACGAERAIEQGALRQTAENFGIIHPVPASSVTGPNPAPKTSTATTQTRGK